MKYVTSLARLWQCGQDYEVWSKLMTYVGATEPNSRALPLRKVYEGAGFWYTLEFMHTVVNSAGPARLFAVWCIQQIPQPPTDPRLISALRVAEDYARGAANDEQLYAAWRSVCVAQEEYERDGWVASVNELTARALVWTVSAVPSLDVVAEAAADAAVTLTRPEGLCFNEPIEYARASAIHAAQTIKFCEMFLMDEPTSIDVPK
jgi:hypothetical protein